MHWLVNNTEETMSTLNMDNKLLCDTLIVLNVVCVLHMCLCIVVDICVLFKRAHGTTHKSDKSVLIDSVQTMIKTTVRQHNCDASSNTRGADKCVKQHI